MSTSFSVAEILARLEARIAHHGDRWRSYAGQIRRRQGGRLESSKLIARVVHRLGEDETLGASQVAQETNRRYRGQLKKPVDARMASVVLRRLRDAGELHQVQSGGAAHEALYSKRPPG